MPPACTHMYAVCTPPTVSESVTETAPLQLAAQGQSAARRGPSWACASGQRMSRGWEEGEAREHREGFVERAGWVRWWVRYRVRALAATERGTAPRKEWRIYENKSTHGEVLVARAYKRPARCFGGWGIEGGGGERGARRPFKRKQEVSRGSTCLRCHM